jgi:hypothetical protein
LGATRCGRRGSIVAGRSSSCSDPARAGSSNRHPRAGGSGARQRRRDQ